MLQVSQFLPAAVSFLLTFAGIKVILKVFPKLGLLDKPGDYGLTRKPVPYSAGIIFFIVFLICTLIFVDITKPIAGVIFAGLLVTTVSFLDDRFKLSPFLRLFVQFLAGVIVVLAGVKIQLINTPFGTPLMLDSFQFKFFTETIWILSGIAIVIWLILMMNVMNWLDGIPGLSSGISAIAQISIFILSMQQFHVVDQSALIIISSVLAASCVAFLIFDFSPPKLLMGDSGSMFLGFMLGALSIISGGKFATALLIMGFPVLDAFWVILKRILRGKSPMSGDLSHFHHKLLNVGLSARKALIFNFAICAVFAAIALLLGTTKGKAIALLSVFLIMGIAGVVVWLLTKRNQRV
ncbi:MAG: MraY family glycosyltransferase [Candidatus Gracilibacteria bacterium]